MKRPPVNPEKLTLRRVKTARGDLWTLYSPRRILGLSGIQLKSGHNTGMYRYCFSQFSIAFHAATTYRPADRFQS